MLILLFLANFTFAMVNLDLFLSDMSMYSLLFSYINWLVAGMTLAWVFDDFIELRDNGSRQTN